MSIEIDMGEVLADAGRAHLTRGPTVARPEGQPKVKIFAATDDAGTVRPIPPTAARMAATDPVWAELVDPPRPHVMPNRAARRAARRARR